jgi:hypothetical protein
MAERRDYLLHSVAWLLVSISVSATTVALGSFLLFRHEDDPFTVSDALTALPAFLTQIGLIIFVDRKTP